MPRAQERLHCDLQTFMCAWLANARSAKAMISRIRVKNRLLDGGFHMADVVIHIEPETYEDRASAYAARVLTIFPSGGDEQIACFRAE